MQDLIIRNGQPQDCELVLDFITRLAEYEKLAHEVVATKEQLHKTLFGEKAYAEVIIAEYKGKPVGFALYFYNYSTFLAKPGLYLEDLYVLPEVRGKKIGKALLVELAKVAVANGCGRFEWWVLDWNKPAIDFYRSIGAVGMDDWTVQRVDGQALEDLANTQL
ncbi:MAG: GNAT family N-acetyltransferase [Kangiellaceae bacterium]|nr:GNAT family N-acetyltransferase [Kangiellaceae bacterium]MCW9015519.1 GNAT family N-acetyltransferase [Kangiellaceae bacterium]